MHFSSAITVDNFRVTFIYNKAGIAGSAMYGEGFDTRVTTFNQIKQCIPAFDRKAISV